MTRTFKEPVKELENEVEVAKRFEPKEFDSRDHLPIEIGASVARGFLKGFTGGSLMTLGIQMVRSSGTRQIIKPFLGGIFGATGLCLTASSFSNWEDAANKFIELIYFRLMDKFWPD